MESILCVSHESFSHASRGRMENQRNKTRGRICSVMMKKTEVEMDSKSLKTTVHQDNWYDRLAIRYLSQNLQSTTGIKNDKEGYESLIEAASAVSQKFQPKEQQNIIIQSLHNAIPSFISLMIKAMLPPSKLTREAFAVFTPFFFSWLIGPSEIRESEIEGRKERNVVHIKKCRFLENSGCSGMCVNLCKLPSERFIKDSFGMPLTMVPNFDDMSCEMIFGQDPPIDDPTANPPCYGINCKAKQRHARSNCST